ncbi:ParA family protein [Botrimarina sp.]|uniref:ParA family protein n=1 Tax=Botrimarina sp. TaxID=2795802 RepID=UPI0032EB748F
MIIALVNSKGGVGKSTLAGNLAAWLFEQGHSVILADCDPQKSSSEWIAEAKPDVQTFTFATSDEILDNLPVLREQADYVVCDGPGSQTETSRALLMWADLAVIPCKASMFEARALALNTAFVRQAQAIRSGQPDAIAVLTMVGRDYRLTKDMRDAAEALDLQLAETPIALRQAYADAPGQSTVVWKMGATARDAAIEIDQLFRELLPEACTENVVPMRRGRGKKRANG